MRILIADPRAIVRRGLKAMIGEMQDVGCSEVGEVDTPQRLTGMLATFLPDMVIAHQSLVTDITLLPRGRFVIVTPQPDISTFLALLARGGRGYLSEQAPYHWLREALTMSGEGLVIDPAFGPWIKEHLGRNGSISVDYEVLTPRELEVLYLMHRGFSDKAIATHLSIAGATVRTHVASLLRKLKVERDEVRWLPVPPHTSSLYEQPPV